MPAGAGVIQEQAELTFLDKVGLALWALIPVLFPIYLFDPGKPQISSLAVIGAGVVALIAGYRLPPGSRRILVPFGYFLWYVVLISAIWAAILENIRLLMPPTFFLYNAFVVLLGLWYYGRAGIRFLKLTQHAMAASVLIQLLMLFFGGPTTARESIYFDNPNQLGYFALTVGAAVLMIAERLRTPTWYRGAVMGICFFLVMVSTSFAAIGGFALLIIFSLKARPGLLVLMALGFASLLSVWDADLFLSRRVEYETEEMEGLSFWESRGYDRISNYPEHVFFGTGEGNYRDFESAIGSHEIHSSYGTLLFSYGMVGTGLFLWFLIALARVGTIRYALYLIPVLMYGGAHQGLRFTMMWVALVLLYCVGDSQRLVGGSIKADRVRRMNAPAIPRGLFS